MRKELVKRSSSFAYLLLITFFVLSSLNSFAWRAKSDTTIYAGAWGGVSYAKIMGYTQPTTPLIGKAFGLQFCYQPNREITLKTGFAFIPKGFIKENEYFDIYNTSVGFYETDYNFNYLNIPLGFSYNLGRNKFNIYLSAGVDIDILLKESTMAKNLPERVNGIEVVNFNSDNTELYKKLNFGVYIGGGIDYRIKPNIIAFADIKYMVGLNNILAGNSIYIFKQRPVVVGIGIKFGIPLKYSVA